MCTLPHLSRRGLRLRNNIVIHLSMLCEYRILTTDCLLELVALVDSAGPGTPAAKPLYSFRLEGTML
jgi:hypothetical protein